MENGSDEREKMAGMSAEVDWSSPPSSWHLTMTLTAAVNKFLLRTTVADWGATFFMAVISRSN